MRRGIEEIGDGRVRGIGIEAKPIEAHSVLIGSSTTSADKFRHHLSNKNKYHRCQITSSTVRCNKL